MNKLTITEKGLAFLQNLSEQVQPTTPLVEEKPQSVQLPSLKREKIEKLHRSKNRKYEVMAERIRQKHQSIQDTLSAAYDKQNDGFWKEWKSGFDIASNWNKDSSDSRSRYQQRVKQRNDNIYTKTWSRHMGRTMQ